jgi:DNA-binding NarL/FixJ family response regulator
MNALLRPDLHVSTTTSSQPARVLLVDDSDAMLARASAVLSRNCVIVGAVKDGTAAIDAAKALRPDVIVLDISMPGMTGLEVAANLRDAGLTAAVVFLTVHDDEEFVVAARQAGATGYVVKLRLVSDLNVAVQEARAGRSFVSTLH